MDGERFDALRKAMAGGVTRRRIVVAWFGAGALAV